MMELLNDAIRTINNPASDNSVRANAFAALESVKSSAPNLFALGLNLILGNSSDNNCDNNNNVHLRCFGLQLIDEVVRLKWHFADGNAVKEGALQLLQLLAAPVSDSNLVGFLAEKTCCSVAGIAGRLWPLEWPDFDQHLRSLYLHNPISQERALWIYKSLAEDTFIFENSVAELRKKDLSVSLIAITVDAAVLNLVYCLDRPSGTGYANGGLVGDGIPNVDLVLNLIRADPQNEGWLHRIVRNLIELKQLPPDTIQSTQVYKLIQLSLETIEVILHWIILDGMRSSRVLYILFELLLSESFDERLAAAKCLISLFSRPSLPSHESFWPVIMAPMFEEEGISKIFAAILKIYACTEWRLIYDQIMVALEQESYDLLKSLAQVISEFGENLLLNKHMKQKPKRFENFLELLYFFTSHPSRTISFSVCHVWTVLAGHETLKHSPEMISYMPRLFSFCVSKISESDLSVNPIIQSYDEIDFNDDSERRACLESNRQRFFDIIHYLVHFQPLESLVMIERHIRFLFFTPHDPVSRNEFGFLEANSIVGYQFEQGGSIFEHVMKNLPNIMDPNLAEKQLLLITSNLFVDILTLDSKDPVVVRCMLSVITCIMESVKDNDSLLKSVEKIFEFVVFTLPDEADFIQRKIILRDETRNLRMKAVTSLVKLGMSLPDTLIVFLENFVSIIKSHVANSLVMEYERVKLIEFCLSVVHYSSKSLEVKTNLVTSIISNYADDWAALNEAPFASGQSLLEALGIAKLAINHGVLSSDEARAIGRWRSKIAIHLRSWILWMKRTKDQPDQWSSVLYKIPPKVFVIIRSVHALGDPKIWHAIPLEYRINMNAFDAEKDAISKHETVFSDESCSAKLFVEETASWITTVRETCYSLIGTIATFGPYLYTLPNLHTITTSHLFNNPNERTNQQWKIFISNVMRPLVLSCPVSAQDEVLGKILTLFIGYMQERVLREWVNNSETKAAERGTQNEEVAAEKILRDLTRTYADFLTSIASFDEGKPIPGANQHIHNGIVKEGSVHQYVMLNKAVFTTVFSSILQLMLLKDTVTCRKSVSAIVKCVPFCARMQHMPPDVCVFLGDPVLKSCLEVLHDGYFQEVHNEVVVLMSEIYLVLRTVNNTSAYETFMSLPGMQLESLQAFDSKFSDSSKSKKERNVIMKDFLRGIKGVSVSEVFREFTKTKSQTQLERQKKSRNVLSEEREVNVIHGLFPE